MTDSHFSGYPRIADRVDGYDQNPIIHADPDVIQQRDNFYMVSSSFNCTQKIWLTTIFQKLVPLENKSDVSKRNKVGADRNRRAANKTYQMNYSKTQRGFTIMEMLTVIAIISIMAVAAISATNSSAASASSKQGAVLASNVLALARSEAVQKQIYAVLLVDAYQDSSNPGNFLHRIMIADAVAVPGSQSTNNFSQVSMWYDLPPSVYFDPTYSTPTTAIPAIITSGSGQIFNGSAYVYTFTPVGELASAGQMVFAVGHENSAQSLPIFEDGTSGTPDTRQGFYLHLLGRPSFFPNATSISSSTH